MTYSNFSKVSILFLTLLIFVAGCQRPVQVITFAAEKRHQQALQHQLDEFSTEHPDVSIKVEWFENDEALTNYIYSAGPKGQLPDLWICRDDDLLGFKNKQWIEAVPPALVNERFIPQLARSVKLNGFSYGVPFEWSTEVLYYNKTIFTKHLIPFPSVNWDWSDLATSAESLTVEGGDGADPITWGVDFSANPEEWLPFISQGCGSIQNEKGQWVATDPQFIQSNLQCIGFYADLVRSYSPGSNLKKSGEAFLNGRAAMIISNRDFVDVLMKNHQAKFEWDISSLPAGRLDASLLTSRVIAMKSGISKNPKILELVTYLTSDIAQTAMALSGLAPVISDLLGSKVFVEYPGPRPVKNEIFKTALTHAALRPRHALSHSVDLVLQEEMQNLINNPDRTERETLEAIQIRLEELDLTAMKNR